jgi:hypothetical protein
MPTIEQTINYMTFQGHIVGPIILYALIVWAIGFIFFTKMDWNSQWQTRRTILYNSAKWPIQLILLGLLDQIPDAWKALGKWFKSVPGAK